MRATKFSNIRINYSTEFGRQSTAEDDAASSQDWDQIARGYHQVKNLFSDHGLSSKARKHYILERDARMKQAKQKWQDTRSKDHFLSYLNHFSSKYITGYGVRLKSVLINVIIATILFASIYFLLEWDKVASLYIQ